MAFDDVIAALERAGCDPLGSGDKFKARCPVHMGEGRSLSVALEGDRTLVKCFAKGCAFDAITEALGLRGGAFFENPRPTAAIARSGGARRRQTRTTKRENMGKNRSGFDKPTLEQMAVKSGTTVEHLRGLGWTEGEGEIEKRGGKTFGVTGVRIPYYRQVEEEEDGSTKLGETWVAETMAKVRTSLEGDPKYLQEQPGQPELYGEWLLEDFRTRDNPFLVLVEGETCFAAQLSQGLPVNGIPGVDTVSKVLRADHLEGFKRLFVVREPGTGGETFCANLAGHLPAIGWTGPVRVVDLPQGDSAEMLCELREGFLDAFRKACEAGVSLNRIAAQSKAQGMIKWASEVEMRPVRFVLDPYIPIGYLTLLAGEAGLGKSTGVVAIAAAISRGKLIGGAKDTSEPGEGRVVIFTGGEDLAEETTVPRYLAAGGDPEKLAVVDDKEVSFENLELISEVVSAVKPSLIVFDPLLRFWPSGLSMNDQETAGPMFEALSDLAREHNSGLMCVLWPPKGKVESAIGMFFGSNAIIGTARSAMTVQVAEDDDPANQIRRGIFSHAKCNVAPLGASFKYELSAEVVEMARDTERFNSLEAEALRRVGSFRWLGVVADTADQVASKGARGGDEGRALAHASRLIREALASGEQPLEVLAAVQRDHGIPFQTYFVARLDVGVVQRTDHTGRVLVSLPGQGPASEEAELEQLVF